MTVSQIPGAVRLRFNQIGVETTLNTAVAATRRVPWRGGITVDAQFADPDADFGSLDPIPQPNRGVLVATSDKTGPSYFNDIPIRCNAGLKGGVSPTSSSTARFWDWQVSSLTSDPFDIFTNQTGDDTEATDTTIGISGVIDSLEDSMSDLGPWEISDSWVYSSATVGGDGTNGLSVDNAGIPVLGGNTVVKMDTTAAAIGTALIASAVHSVTVRVQNNLDIKHFANGSNSLNQAGGFGRGERVIELVLTVAKTAAMVTEANTFLTSPKPSRFFQVLTVSDSLAAAGFPYTDSHKGAFRLWNKEETEIGGNVVLTLTYRAYYDSTLGYAYRRQVTNTQTTVAAP